MFPCDFSNQKGNLQIKRVKQNIQLFLNKNKIKVNSEKVFC